MLSIRCLVLVPALLAGLGASARACDGSLRVAGAAASVLVLAEGDSITFGQGSTDGMGSYVQRTCLLSDSGIETIVAAKSRAVLGSPADAPGANSLWGRAAADNAVLAGKGKRRAILSILIGRNDLVGYGGGSDAYADDLVKFVRAMRRAGWDRVIVGTVLPSTWEPFDPLRDDLNSILKTKGWARAHDIDAIADFAASPVMGHDGAAADKAYYADGIHPSDRGYGLLAPIYGKAVAAVIAHGR